MSAETYAREQLDAAKNVRRLVQDRLTEADAKFEALMRQFAQAGTAGAAAYDNELLASIDEVARAKNRVTFAEALVAKREQEWRDATR